MSICIRPESSCVSDTDQTARKLQVTWHLIWWEKRARVSQSLVSQILRWSSSWKWHSCSCVKDLHIFRKTSEKSWCAQVWATLWSVLWTGHWLTCWLSAFAMWPKQTSTYPSESECDHADLSCAFFMAAQKTDNCFLKWRKQASMVSCHIFAFYFNDNQMHRNLNLIHFLFFLDFHLGSFLISDRFALADVSIAFHPVIPKEIKCLKVEVPSP